MKRDIQRIMLATAVPLFLIFILFLLKIVEVGMGWDFSHMGIYPLEKRGITGILTHPLIHSGFSHLLANTLPLFFFIVVLVLFLQGDSRTYFYDHLDRSRTADLHYRQTGMAHRCQRTDLRTCLLSFFQWYPAEICSSDCHLTACHLFVWRNHLAYVPLLLSRQHVMGRTSQRRNHGNTLCIRFLESRASTTRTFCGRNG